MVCDMRASRFRLWASVPSVVGFQPQAAQRRTENRSELSRMFFCPALDYNLLLSIKLSPIATLPVHNPEETVFPAAEREIGHGRGDSDVDADVSGGRFIAEAAHGSAA